MNCANFSYIFLFFPISFPNRFHISYTAELEKSYKKFAEYVKIFILYNVNGEPGVVKQVTNQLTSCDERAVIA